MKRTAVWAAGACVARLLAAACTTITPEGAKVKVYETNAATPPDARKLPEGCRLSRRAPRQQRAGAPRGRIPTASSATRRRPRRQRPARPLGRSASSTRPIARRATTPSTARALAELVQVVLESYACDAAALEALADPAPRRESSPGGRSARLRRPRLRRGTGSRSGVRSGARGEPRVSRPPS